MNTPAEHSIDQAEIELLKAEVTRLTRFAEFQARTKAQIYADTLRKIGFLQDEIYSLAADLRSQRAMCDQLAELVTKLTRALRSEQRGEEVERLLEEAKEKVPAR